MRKVLLTVLFLCAALWLPIAAQTPKKNAQTIIVLPFENKSGKSEFNWVGESFPKSLSELLDDKGLNVISNQERKIIQQEMRIPLTALPSLATSLKLALRAKATLLVIGDYNIFPEQGEISASVNVNARVLRVEGGILSEDFPEGRRIGFAFNEALPNLQKIQGQLAWEILYRIDKVLNKLDKNAFPFSESSLVEAANKVPARAFEGYVKGVLFCAETGAPKSDDDQQKCESFLKNSLRIYAEEKSGATYTDAALELGHFYLRQRKFSEAVEYFSRIPQSSEQYPEAAFYTGLILWQQENYEGALGVLRPLAEDLKLTSVYNTIGAIAVQASRAEKKNKGKAAALLNEGLELLKKAADSADENNARFNYGYALFINNNYTAAIEQLRPVLAVNPRDGEAYFLLAKSLESLKDASAADFDNQARRFLTEGDKYAKLQTEWSRSRTTEAISLRVVQPARKDFVSVILRQKQITPVQTPVNETESLLNQARQFYKEGRDDEATAVLRKVLSGEPMSAESYYLLGMIYLRQGDLEQAQSSLKTAIFWDNRLTNAYIALVKIYIEKKDCQQAQTFFRSALEIAPENPEVQGLQRLIEKCSTK